MFRNSGENSLNRLSPVSFFIGAEGDCLQTSYSTFQLTFSINVPVIKRNCELLRCYVLLSQFHTLPIKVYIEDGGFLGK